MITTVIKREKALKNLVELPVLRKKNLSVIKSYTRIQFNVMFWT